VPEALAPTALRLEPLLAPWLDQVLQIEVQAYDHPWTREHFLDVLSCGYQAQMLVAEGRVLGYFVAMQGVGEAHLLNITVAPEYQGRGYARYLLELLNHWARCMQAQRVWLEVRVGNARAIRLYEAFGYQRVNVRKDYYPGFGQQREDALVMYLPLDEGDAP
jgi:ribosomal-protein-alanine N-acetyltransferase